MLQQTVLLLKLVQARNEGRDLAREGGDVIRAACKWSPELAAACEVWKEIKFEFDTIDKLLNNIFRFISNHRSRMKGIPGVEKAALTDALPLNGRYDDYIRRGKPSARRAIERNVTTSRNVTTEYFSLLDLKLMHGRLLDAQDSSGGFGTLIPDAAATISATRDALEAGFRHFDCAERYRNEREVGEALQAGLAAGGIAREDIFVTTKLWNTNHRPERVEPAFEASLDRLGLNYLDLYLIHTPFAFQPGDEQDPRDQNGNILYDRGVTLLETWRAMESLVDSGRCRAIGLSDIGSAYCSSNPLHIMRSSSSTSALLNCGTKTQPWVLEAPAGQQINVSLLDFGLQRQRARSEEERTSSTAVSSMATSSTRQRSRPTRISPSVDWGRKDIGLCISPSQTLSRLYFDPPRFEQQRRGANFDWLSRFKSDLYFT